METARFAFSVVGICAFAGGIIASFAGWEGGALVTQGVIVVLLVLSAITIIGRYYEVQNPEPLAPVRHSAGPRTANFISHRYRREDRGMITGGLAFCTTLALGGAIAFVVARWTGVNESDGFAYTMAAVLAVLGAACGWMTFQAWIWHVQLERDGVTVHMYFTRGKFRWSQLLAFERVQLPDGDGYEKLWFRLVTARKVYLVQDVLVDGERFVDTVERASGLRLVDVN